MKVIVNSRFLTQSITGVQRFAIEMCREMRVQHPDLHFVSPLNIKEHELAKDWGVEKIGATSGHRWEQFTLPAYLRKQKSPLLINLCNTAPLLYSNQLVTIHDMAFKVNPSWFSKSFALYYSFLVPRIARRSKAIATVSEASRSDIAKYTKVSASKVSVVHNAIPDLFIQSKSSGSEVPELPDRFILAVGSLDPRKNLKKLIEAFNLANIPNLKLFIVGGTHQSFSQSELKGLLDQSEHVELTGYLDGDVLKAYYQQAMAFVNVSFYEGFGIPNLEAMALNCPVVASDIPVFREVLGDAVHYTDPDSPQAIAQSIKELVENDTLRRNLAAAGKTQAMQYSYRESASKLLGVIRALQTTSA